MGIAVRGHLCPAAIAHGKGTFAAVRNRELFFSDDGVNWQRPGGIEDGYGFRDVIFDGGRFVATRETWCTEGSYEREEGRILESTDAKTWTEYVPEKLPPIYSISYGNGTFVGIGYSESSRVYLLGSHDLKKWTQVLDSKWQQGASQIDLAFGNGRFVAVVSNYRQGGVTLTSEDGWTWMRYDTALELQSNWEGMSFENGQFYVVGPYGVSTSVDGISWAHWKQLDLPELFAPVAGAGSLVTVGEAGVIYSLADGANWTEVHPRVQRSLRGVAYGENGYVAVGERVRYDRPRGMILMSIDGEHWNAVRQDVDVPLSAVAFGRGTYVAVGGDPTAGGSVLTSGSGERWTLVSRVAPQPLNAVAFGNGQFVSVGLEGVILRSENGNEWAPSSVSKDFDLGGVTYIGNDYFAFGSERHHGIVLRSQIGETWRSFRVDDARSVVAMEYSGDRFFALAIRDEGGTGVLESIDGEAWDEIFAFPDCLLTTLKNRNGELMVFGGVRRLEPGRGGSVSPAILLSRNGREWVHVNRIDPLRYGVSGLLHAATFGHARGVAVSARGILSAGLVDGDRDANDSFDRPYPLAPEVTSFVKVPKRATLEYSTSTGGGSSGRAGDLWWKWRAPGDARVTIRARQSEYESRLHAYSYSTGRELLPVGAGLNEGGVAFEVRGGSAFRISSTVQADQVVRFEIDYDFIPMPEDFDLRQHHPQLPLFGARDLDWGNGRFATVGDDGKIWTSRDGELWKERSSGVSGNIHRVAFLDDRFLAFAESTALVSTNGKNWKAQALNLPTIPHSITFGGGYYYCLSKSGHLFSSKDGFDWERLNSPHDSAYSDLLFEGGKLILFGRRSSHHEEGTEQGIAETVSGFPDPSWSSQLFSARRMHDGGFSLVSFGNRILAHSRGSAFLSADGKQWTHQYSPPLSSLEEMIAGEGVLVALAGYQGDIYASKNGVEWLPTGESKNNRFRATAFGGGRFVAIGREGAVARSENGYDWEIEAPFSSNSALLTGIASGEGVLVAVGVAEGPRPHQVYPEKGYFEMPSGSAGFVITSRNGEIWQSVGDELPAGAGLRDVAFANGIFVAVGAADEAGATLLTSSDGVVWQRRNVNSRHNLRDITVHDGRFYAVGGNESEGGVALVSSDGENWEVTRLGKPFSGLFRIAAGPKLIAIGNDENGNGVILYSDDGSDWDIEGDYTTETPMRDILYANGLFALLMEGDYGVSIFTTFDGTAWDYAGRCGARRLAFGKGVFLGYSTYDLWASGDLKNWVSVKSSLEYPFNMGYPLTAALFEDDRFYLVGSHARIYSMVSLPYPVSAPKGLSASDGLSDVVVLKWESVPEADSYTVYRGDTTVAYKADVIAEEVDSASFTDEPAAHRNYYWVSAKRGMYRSAFSEVANGTTEIEDFPLFDFSP